MAACLEEEEEEGFIGLGGDLETMACVEEEEEEGFFMPPFLCEDEEETALLEAVNAELVRREAEQAKEEDGRRRRGAAHHAVLDSILERDPKTGWEVYTRYSFTDFSIFDIDEESLIPPMRFTNTGYIRWLEPRRLCKHTFGQDSLLRQRIPYQCVWHDHRQRQC